VNERVNASKAAQKSEEIQYSAKQQALVNLFNGELA